MAKIYICRDCGATFEEPKATRECVGECWGSPAWDTAYSCPFCGSDNYDDAVECECCGELFCEDELTEGLCEDCLHSHDGDYKLWYEACKKQKFTDTVNLNMFLLSQFTAEEIEVLLRKELANRQKVDCSDFVSEDPEWASYVIKNEEEIKGGK